MTTVAGKPWAPVRGKRMRLTRLNNLYGPDTVGTQAMGISSGFVSAKIAPQYDDGQKVQQFNANGDLSINEPGQVTLLNVQADLLFVGVDPDLFTLITGQQEVLDGTGAGVGMQLAGGIPVTYGFALEVWTGVAGNSATVAAGQGTAWGYLLLPFLYGGKVSDFTIENGAANFTLATVSREGSTWGAGPYNVVDTNASGTGPATPGKLTTVIGAKTHTHLQYTTIAPPAAIAGLATVPVGG